MKQESMHITFISASFASFVYENGVNIVTGDTEVGSGPQPH